MSPDLIPGLLEAALRSLAGALAVYGGLRIFRVSNVLAQKAAWGLVLAASLLMPMLMHWQGLPSSAAIKLPLPAWRVSPAPTAAVASRSIPETTMVVSGQPQPQVSAPPVSPAVAGDRFPAPTISSSNFNAPAPTRPGPAQYAQSPSAPRSAPHSIQPLPLAALLYLLVSSVLLFRIAYGLVTAFMIWKSATPILATARPPFTRGMSLRASMSVSSPVTIGSAVVLPADYVEWDAEKLRIVLAHENSHIRQGDFYLQLLAGVYAVAFWFSPLGWWLKRKLSELGETISDRAGLEEAASSASYAQILLEFAALPRPTFIGVAMARRSNLSHRIERLLNESSFRQAFAGSRRMLLAVLLVPIMLFAATALVRVEAAGKAPQQDPAPSSASSLTGQAHPDPTPASIEPSAVESAMPPAPKSPAAPATPSGPGVTVIPDGEQSAPPSPEPPNADNGYSYRWSSNRDSWALVTDSSQHVTFSGDWHNSTHEMIEKVRGQGHEKFLLFTRNGKSYFIDEPAIVAQIEAMYKPMEALGRQQEELGKKQEELGKQQEELGRKQEMATIPAPDMAKEMAELKAAMTVAMAKIDAKKAGAISQEELAELDDKIGATQGKLGELQGKIGAEQGKFGALQGKLGEEQGKLGAEQGRLGAEQGRIGAEADRLVRKIIDESLSNGKARPVQ